MKKAFLLIPSIIIVLLAGCASDDDKTFIPGYISPGSFRPRGVATEKAYRFSNVPVVITGRTTTCGVDTNSAGADFFGAYCMAMHSTWLTGTSYTTNNLPMTAIGVNDTHLTPSIFKFSMVQSLTGGWDLTIVNNGLKYKGHQSDSAFRFTIIESYTETTPALDVNGDDCNPTPPDNTADNLAGSGKPINLVYIEFLRNIPMYLTDPNTPAFNIIQTELIPATTRTPISFTVNTGTCPPTVTYTKNYPPGDFIIARKAGL